MNHHDPMTHARGTGKARCGRCHNRQTKIGSVARSALLAGPLVEPVSSQHMSDIRYNIGQLAKAAGVPTTTVRFYERQGVLSPVGRTISNYRWYDQHAVEQLRFIRLAHTGGFSLKDIAGLLEEHNGSAAQCRRVAAIIENRLKKVHAQIAELRTLEQLLKQKLQLCQGSKPRRCAVVDELETAAKNAPNMEPRQAKLKTMPI
ncbi:MAG: heavy metal-responsive transcriptional regulator [Phycisphaerae bacterium]|nr:heavy metal-responsive transcriptional regulator [Phycisphaerae bacterium]